MRFTLACFFLIASITAASAHAQFGMAWHRTPAITVMSPESTDARLDLVDEAVAFWNKTLEELGSGFRLGAVTRVAGPVPEDAIRSLSDSVLAGRREPSIVPELFRDIPGDLIIVLAHSNFISFAGPFFADTKRVVGIKGMQFSPLTLPNVARNVIAHELGHAIGLRHNSDPTKLMCGRPSPCRPDGFRSSKREIFPLTEDEKLRLGAMYPAHWKPQSRE